MRRVLIATLAWLLAASQAFGQVPYFPQTLPPNTVVGNQLATPGPTQAIPLSTLAKGLSLGPFTTFPLAGATTGTVNLTVPSSFSNWTLTLPSNPGTSGFFLGTDGLGNASWQGYVPSGTGAITRSWQSKAGDFVSVLDYGAVGNGTTDDTAAIQAAINACPAQGCTINFPALTYKISSTLTIGNGSSSGTSTKQGVILQGLGNPVRVNMNGFAVSTGPKLVWAGGTNTDFVKLAGPLIGWGVSNLIFDGGSTQGLVGLHVTAAGFGEARNLSFYNVWRAIVSDAIGTVTGQVPPVGGSMDNNYNNITITLPNLTGPVIGILLTGDGLASPLNDTFNNTFSNVLFIPGTFPLTNNTFGLYLQVCDSNTFTGLHMWSGSTATLTPLTFDYQVATAFPTANMIYGMDFDGGTIGFSGTPVAGLSPNYINGIMESNGSFQQNVPGLNYTPSIPSLGSLKLIAQTAAIPATSLFSLGNLPSSFWRISYYLEVTALGTAGTINLQLVWKDTINATETFNSATVPASGSTGFTSGSVVIRTEGTPNPTYAVLFNSVTGSPQFRLFMKVEKMD